MKLRRELGIWFLILAVSVLLIGGFVQVTTRLTLAGGDKADLNATLPALSGADVGRDSGQHPLAPLAAAVSDSAQLENEQLRLAHAALSGQSLQEEPDFSLRALLFATPTPIPTQLLRIPPTATPAPTKLPSKTEALAASATPSLTWTATVTSLPAASLIVASTQQSTAAPSQAAAP